MLRVALVDQRRRIADDRALGLLLAAESASGLAAVEMGLTGLPWRVDIHLELLADMLGPRPRPGERPQRLAELAAEIDGAFGFAVNPDSAVDLRAAFRRAGFEIDSTRSWVIKELTHPAVAPVLAYKELSRVHTANGWNWLDEWARGGRFRPEYLPGSVVSGRWATRGGGALQIPRALRKAVVADPAIGWSSPTPRSWNRGCWPRSPVMLRCSGFRPTRTCTPRWRTTGSAAIGRTPRWPCSVPCTARPRARPDDCSPPCASAIRSDGLRGERGAAGRGRRGGAFRARPGLSAAQRDLAGGGRMSVHSRTRRTPNDDGPGSIARDRGRFTRNFVVQGSAADWASVWLSGLRRDLRAVTGAELVFFQHDELIVHVPGDERPDGRRSDDRGGGSRAPAGLSDVAGDDAGSPGDRGLLCGREMSSRAAVRAPGRTGRWCSTVMERPVRRSGVLGPWPAQADRDPISDAKTMMFDS